MPRGTRSRSSSAVRRRCRRSANSPTARRSSLLTKITGVLNRVLEDRVRVQVGPLEYEILVPELTRRQVQLAVGKETTFHVSHYLEGNPMQGRMVPRLVGFLTEPELEFFELFCTVDKVGVRKALRALTMPIRDVADAIQRQDVKLLTTLPGVGGATAEQIVTSLKKKVVKFALIPPRAGEPAGASQPQADEVANEAYQALLALGNSPAEARKLLEKALASGKKHATAEDVLATVYQQLH